MSRLKALESKVIPADQIYKVVNRAKLSSKQIVFTNGCFDILHRGHVTYLAKAADLGDILIVGLNSDSSVRRLGKGDSRPIQDEQSRAAVLAAIGFVDHVVIFNDDTPLDLIKIIQPHILVKGGDWKIEEIVGYDVVMNNGGLVTTIPFEEGFSTSSIEQKILSHGNKG